MTKAPPILGLQACEKLALTESTDCSQEQPKQERPAVDAVTSAFCHLSKTDVLEEFHGVFTGLGKFDQFHITIEEKPVIQAPRRVPHGLQDRLKEKLDQMEHERITAKTDKPTDWVKSLVIVEKKDGGLRLCLDPKDLNSAIRREHFQILTFEDVVSRLGGNTHRGSSGPPSDPCLSKYFSREIPAETTSPEGLSVATPQAPKRRVSERQRNKPL